MAKEAHSSLVQSLKAEFDDPEVSTSINVLQNRPYVLNYVEYVTNGLASKRSRLYEVQMLAAQKLGLAPSNELTIPMIKAVLNRIGTEFSIGDDIATLIASSNDSQLELLNEYYHLTNFISRYGSQLLKHGTLSTTGFLLMNGIYDSFSTFSGRMTAKSDANGRGFSMMSLPGLMTSYISSPFDGEKLIGFDIPNAEILSLYFVSGDESLLEAITAESSIYRQVAVHLFKTENPTDKEIKIAKTTLIARTYGQHADSVKQNLVDRKQLISIDQLSTFYKWFNHEYSTAWKFMSMVAADNKIWMLGSRTRHPSIELSGYQRQNAVNASVIAKLLKRWAVLIVQSEAATGIRLVNVIHDNVVVSVSRSVSTSLVSDTLLQLLRDAMRQTEIWLPVSHLTNKEFGE